jgi:cytochrome c553
MSSREIPRRVKQKAVMCSACHGADGNSMVPSFPKLAGLGEKYLLRQMQYIRDGVRPVAQMAGQVDNLSDQDLADIAAYYTQFPRSVEKADPALVELGEKVYRGGIAERNVAACIACHGPRGGGNAPAGFPATWRASTRATSRRSSRPTASATKPRRPRHRR